MKTWSYYKFLKVIELLYRYKELILGKWYENILLNKLVTKIGFWKVKNNHLLAGVINANKRNIFVI